MPVIVYNFFKRREDQQKVAPKPTSPLTWQAFVGVRPPDVSTAGGDEEKKEPSPRDGSEV